MSWAAPTNISTSPAGVQYGEPMSDHWRWPSLERKRTMTSIHCRFAAAVRNAVTASRRSSSCTASSHSVPLRVNGAAPADVIACHAVLPNQRLACGPIIQTGAGTRSSSSVHGSERTSTASDSEWRRFWLALDEIRVFAGMALCVIDRSELESERHREIIPVRALLNAVKTGERGTPRVMPARLDIEGR